MIKLEVEEYCHQDCREFTPCVIRTVTPYQPCSFGDETTTTVHTSVQGEHRKRCAVIERYLRQQMKGEQK